MNDKIYKKLLKLKENKDIKSFLIIVVNGLIY